MTRVVMLEDYLDYNRNAVECLDILIGEMHRCHLSIPTIISICAPAIPKPRFNIKRPFRNTHKVFLTPKFLLCHLLSKNPQTEFL